MPTPPAPQRAEILPDVKNIVAVASGKGGVGKTTVSGQSRCFARQTGRGGWPARRGYLRPQCAADDGREGATQSARTKNSAP